MTAKQLMKKLRAVPPDSLVVFGGACLTIKEKPHPLFRDGIKQICVDTGVIPLEELAHHNEQGVNFVILAHSFGNPTAERIEMTFPA